MNNEQKYKYFIIIIISIEGLQQSKPHRVTSGLFNVSNLTTVKINTKHAHYTNVTYINIIRTLVPSSVWLSANKVRRCWYH